MDTIDVVSIASASYVTRKTEGAIRKAIERGKISSRYILNLGETSVTLLHYTAVLSYWLNDQGGAAYVGKREDVLLSETIEITAGELKLRVLGGDLKVVREDN